MAKKPKSKTVPCAIAVYGSLEWREWLNEFARSQRIPVACLVDRVLSEEAKRRGFPTAPPRL